MSQLEEFLLMVSYFLCILPPPQSRGVLPFSNLLEIFFPLTAALNWGLYGCFILLFSDCNRICCLTHSTIKRKFKVIQSKKYWLVFTPISGGQEVLLKCLKGMKTVFKLWTKPQMFAWKNCFFFILTKVLFSGKKKRIRFQDFWSTYLKSFSTGIKGTNA